MIKHLKEVAKGSCAKEFFKDVVVPTLRDVFETWGREANKPDSFWDIFKSNKGDFMTRFQDYYAMNSKGRYPMTTSTLHKAVYIFPKELSKPSS